MRESKNEGEFYHSPLISISHLDISREVDIKRSMSEIEEKETIIRLDVHQYKHLITTISEIVQEINNIADKLDNRLEKLENGLAKIEGELRLIRMKISELKEKTKK